MHREFFRLYDNTAAVSQNCTSSAQSFATRPKPYTTGLSTISIDDIRFCLAGLIVATPAAVQLVCIAGTSVKGTRKGPWLWPPAIMMRAGYKDLQRWSTIKVSFAALSDLFLACCCQKCRARNISNESISRCRRSTGTWMAQPNFRGPVRPTWRVHLTQRCEAEELHGRASIPGLTHGIAAGSCLAGG